MEETTIAASARGAFESAQKEYCAAVVRGGAPSCLVLAPTVFAPGDRYVTLLSFSSFAHYDQGTYTSKGLSPDEARQLASRREPTIASNQESAIQLRFPGHEGQDRPRPLVLVTEVHVFPGRAEDLVALMQKRVRPAAQSEHSPEMEIYQVEANGDPDRLLILQPLEHFADLDATLPLSAAVPASKRRAFDQAFARDVRSSSVTVMRYRPDLSSLAR